LHHTPRPYAPQPDFGAGLERLTGEVKRRTEVFRIFPNDDVIIPFIGAILVEQNDEWTVQRARYVTLESMAALSDRPGSHWRPYGQREQLRHDRGRIL
jgi:putative transposase